MRRLIGLTIMVLTMVVSGTAKASFLDHYFGGMYRSSGCGYYGYGGGIISEVANWQIANRIENREDRKLDIAEKYIEKMDRQGEQQSQRSVYGVVVRDQSQEIQQLRLENKNLREENTELKKELKEMRKELLELKQMLQGLIKQK